MMIYAYVVFAEINIFWLDMTWLDMVDRIAIKTIYEGNIYYGFDDMKGTFL